MTRRIRRMAIGLGTMGALLVALPAGVSAAEPGPVDKGDTAWMLASTALVMIMLPGLALFYGGLVRRKNVLSTIMHSFFGLALVSVVWVIVGFSLAFGPDVNGMGLIGNLDYVGFNNVGLAPSTVYATTIPFLLFATFQLMFAAITPALITGAFAERKRFGAFVLFTSCGRSSSTRRSPTGSGRPTAGCSSSARSTSRAAPSSTSAPACRP